MASGDGQDSRSDGSAGDPRLNLCSRRRGFASLHCGRRRLQAFVAARSARNRPPGAAAGPAGRRREPRCGWRSWPWPSAGFRFLLPFNWRGFYDFGSSLIGDWGVHILGPANWALQLDPKYLVSVECIKKDSLPAFTFPDELAIKYEFAARPGMPAVTIYWYHHAGGDAYTPPGMTVEEARKIPGKGPQVGPVSDRADSCRHGRRNAGGRSRSSGGTAPQVPAAAGVRRAAGTTASSLARRDTWAQAGAAKAWDCCRVPDGRNTSCPMRT